MCLKPWKWVTVGGICALYTRIWATKCTGTVSLGHDDVVFDSSDLFMISGETNKVVLISSANVAHTMTYIQYGAGMNTYPVSRPLQNPRSLVGLRPDVTVASGNHGYMGGQYTELIALPL